MQTAGKFYIWLNGAYTENHYWSRENQHWTTNPHDASFFDTIEDAENEPVFCHGDVGAALILQASRNI